jgi:phosphate uptake regulator
MARIMDSPLDNIRSLLRSLQRRVDDLVSEALITTKDPFWDLGTDAESQDQEISRLERELQETFRETLVRHNPFARDHRFLLATFVTSKELRHMGTCAKDICQRARDIRKPSDQLQTLLNLTQRRASECFRALYQLELDEISLAMSLSTGRHEIEKIFNDLLGVLEGVDLTKVGPKELEAQILVAMDLKRICESVVSIAEQLIFYKTGAYGSPEIR